MLENYEPVSVRLHRLLTTLRADGIESPTHHLAELTSIYPRLPSGCIIAVDDCKSETHGKHRFVRDWLLSLGVRPLLESYVTVWRKP